MSSFRHHVNTVSGAQVDLTIEFDGLPWKITQMYVSCQQRNVQEHFGQGEVFPYASTRSQCERQITKPVASIVFAVGKPIGIELFRVDPEFRVTMNKIGRNEDVCSWGDRIATDVIGRNRASGQQHQSP